MTSVASTRVPASPSTPSIMFIALIRPTVANTVIGTDSVPSGVSPMPNTGPRCSMRTPPP